MSSQRITRLAREITVLRNEGPRHCIFVISEETTGASLNRLIVELNGPEGSPFANKTFSLLLTFPARYPFEPPGVCFLTAVYHPNIDMEGHICLDLLKMPPDGAWKPTISTLQLLEAVRLLLAEPNPEDPLMPNIVMLIGLVS